MEPYEMDAVTLQLAVIWKKLDNIQRKVDGMGPRTAPISVYLKELRDETEKMVRQM